MKGRSAKSNGSLTPGKTTRTNRKKSRRDFIETLYDMDYINRMVESMEFSTGEAGMLDELLNESGDWE